MMMTRRSSTNLVKRLVPFCLALVAFLYFPFSIFKFETTSQDAPLSQYESDSSGMRHLFSPQIYGNLFGGLNFDEEDQNFAKDVLLTGLHSPKTLLCDIEGFLWVTEQHLHEVHRINPVTRHKITVLRIPNIGESRYQDGLLGMAFHAEFLKNPSLNYVYLSHTYLVKLNMKSVIRKLKVVRYTFNVHRQILEYPRDLLTNIPSDTRDHNCGALTFSQFDNMLYLSVGDHGNNQFKRMCYVNHAQTLPTAADVEQKNYFAYQGKVLRFYPDPNRARSIPTDNPLINNVRSHIFSYGHRNAQGLAFSSNGRLFSSEHGPLADDELNWLQPGKNYGWPFVSGFRDDQYYEFVNYSAVSTCHTRSELSTAERQKIIHTPGNERYVKKETAWTHPNYAQPLMSFFTVPNTYTPWPSCNATASDCPVPERGVYFNLPSIAPSSLRLYNPKLVRDGLVKPAWKESLLIPALKGGRLFRVPLDQFSAHEATELCLSLNRYRDLAIDYRTLTFYVITDKTSSSSYPASFLSNSVLHQFENPGAILRFQYRQPEAS